jgi:hypothetical protein
MLKECKSLYHNRFFLIFWIGQTLSVTGDAFATVALPLLVLQATGSVVEMGFVTATFAVSSVVSNLLSGIIVDCMDRRWLMIICDTRRLLLYGSIPLLVPAQDLFIFHLKHDLIQSDGAVGLIFSLAALGGIFGGLLASVLRGHLGFGVSWLGALTLIGIHYMRSSLTLSLAIILFTFPYRGRKYQNAP